MNAVFAIACARLAAVGSTYAMRQPQVISTMSWNKASSENACGLLVHGAFRVDPEELLHLLD